MLFLIWTIVGMSLALIWHWLFGPRNTEQAARQLLLAVTGAVVGGVLFMLFGTTTWTSVNSYSLVVSMFGALTFLAAYRSIKQAY
ncbi:MAG: hypothetical protein KA368_16790 [Acidobacteria bacterium]|nr:hypothetical protein [Acidobacteriota bacterium]